MCVCVRLCVSVSVHIYNYIYMYIQQKYHIIVLGLDSLEARRWINDMICRYIDIHRYKPICTAIYTVDH